MGNRTRMEDGSGISEWTYTTSGLVASTTQQSVGKAIAYTYNAEGRRTKMSVTDVTPGTAPPWDTEYGYDVAGRLATLLDKRIDAETPFRYTWVGGLTTSVTTPTGLLTEKSFDNTGRLSQITGKTAYAQTINAYAYEYNAASQRKKETTPVWEKQFEYDPARQLIAAYKPAGQGRDPAFDYSYQYDSIGNRLQRNRGGETTTYTRNAVNQYTGITVGANPVITPTYDLNGSLLNDGSRTYTYTEESQLKTVERNGIAYESRYDGQMRRTAYHRTNGENPSEITKYLYDGWLILGELDENNAFKKRYTWGVDLSGGQQGAGGIGGLLAQNSEDVTRYYFYDGNGNVVDMTDGEGAVMAHYEYSPFGGVVMMTGPEASENSFRFSTKSFDVETGLSYYGYRYYDAELGRWISRDPIEEAGGINLYGFVLNDPIGLVDPFGAAASEWADRADRYIEEARSFYKSVSEEYWVWHGLVDTVADLTKGFTDLLRLGSRYGALDKCSTLKDWGYATIEEGLNALDIVLLGRLSAAKVLALKNGSKLIEKIRSFRFQKVQPKLTPVNEVKNVAVKTEVSLAERILAADRTGSGLKPDVTHQAASFLSKEQLEAGTSFIIEGGDGVVRELLQTPGVLNGRSGIFEYILDPSKGVTHQRFIPGGKITGVPNQKVP